MIRDAALADAAAITRIYAHHVRNGATSFETDPPTVEEMAKRIEHVLDARWPWIVGEESSHVVGYAYATQIRDRPAYRYTAENSIYVTDGHARQGIGHALLTTLIARAEHAGFRQMIAVIGGADPASIALHAVVGFRHAGRLEAAGWKHGRWLDTVYMQLPLGSGATGHPE
jgi:L-amino acid N-acyltransferase YncA